MMKFPFIDLQAQQNRIAPQIEQALQDVLDHGAYILGPEVDQFEQELAKFEQVKQVVACANGTDALVLPLMAWGIGPGDAVFCPSFTYTATAESIALVGATPVFVDILPDTYTMCAHSLAAAVAHINTNTNLKPKAVMVVDLFGQAANYPKLAPIAQQNGLKLISDCAQATGCRLDGKSTGYWADIATSSFFPAKPLGCYGDGGAMLMNDAKLADKLRSLAFHGRSATVGDTDAIGMNSRLDTIQAAILLEKLKIFIDEIQVRNQVAERYGRELFSNKIKTPRVAANGVSTWAQYTIEVENRDAVMTKMKADGIPVAAYYPRPIHLQSAYQGYPVTPTGLPNTEQAMHRVLALPMHAYLTDGHQDQVVASLQGALRET